MENPAYWGSVTKVINEAVERYNHGGQFGSLAREIYNQLTAYGWLNDEAINLEIATLNRLPIHNHSQFDLTIHHDCAGCWPAPKEVPE